MDVYGFKKEWEISFKNGKPTERYVEMVKLMVEKDVDRFFNIFNTQSVNKKP